ncbi:hypothetical protein YC2023_045052 [Brassica napus]
MYQTNSSGFPTRSSRRFRWNHSESSWCRSTGAGGEAGGGIRAAVAEPIEMMMVYLCVYISVFIFVILLSN